MSQTTQTNPAAAENRVAPDVSNSLIARMAERLQVDPTKLWNTMAKTCFKPEKGGLPFSSEEIMYVLMIAEQLEINPLRRELWAFRGKNGSVQPIVSIDGWKAIMLRQPNFDGYQVVFSDTFVDIPEYGKLPEWAECTIWLKNISHPTVERVFTEEVFMSSSLVWKKSPRLMLHHRALIQAIRFSFPVTGISDVGVTDDGEVIQGDDLVNERMASDGQLSNGQARPAKPPVKAISFDNDKLNEIGMKAVNMARKSNNYAPALKFAQGLDANAREYVTHFIKQAQEEDRLKAMQLQDNPMM